MPKYGKAIRHYWHLEADCIFLNHGSFGATPIGVLAAQTRWQERIESQPVRFMGQELAPSLWQAQTDLANFLGGNPDNLVFQDNATAGINTVLRSIVWQPGEQIFTTNHVYGAVRQSLKFISKRYGVKVTEIPIPFPTTTDQILEIIQAALQEPPRLLLIDHITSPTALIFPIESIIQTAHDRGVLVLVDGAHAPGMLPLNLEQLQADWYVGNCHKWLCAPKGCAFLYTMPQHQDSTHPLSVSHSYGSDYQTEFSWTGTKDFSSWLSVSDAIIFLQSLDFNALRAYNHELLWQSVHYLWETWGLPFSTPKPMLGSMATLPLPDRLQQFEVAQLHDLLWQKHQIEVPIIPWHDRLWIRISVQGYNEFSDYDRLSQVIKYLMDE